MTYSRVHWFRCLSAAVVVLGSVCASGQVLRGTVTNGTTKKPAAGDDVLLLKLDKGMDEEVRTKANARGEFSFELPESQTMRAVRVRHQNVNYFQPVMPGSTSVTVTVYEAATLVPGVHQTNQSVIMEAQGNTLRVYEIFNVRNDSQPPRTQPAFSFYLPEGAKVESGQAMREGGMPLRVAAVPQGGNRYSVPYPLMPGATHIEFPYTLAYAGTLKFQPKLAGAVEKFYVVTPKSMSFAAESGAQYQTTEAESVAPDLKGMDMHVASNTTDEKQLAFSVTGEGRIPQQTAQAGRGQEGNARGDEDNRPGGGMGIPNERPNPLSSGEWKFLGVLTLFMAAGATIVFVTARGQGAVAAAQPPNQSSPVLDVLKEEMFELEAERLQGKINSEEYETAKAALVKTLQRAMSRKNGIGN
jgi:hypothetical protein